MYLKELDSITHLSFDGKNKILQGVGLSRGSDSVAIQTESGGLEHIKAGKFPVMFFANTKLKVQSRQKHRTDRAGYDLTRLQKRVTALQSKLNSNDKSRSTQGTQSSV